MKRLIRFFVNVMAVIVLSVSALSLTACNDVSSLEVRFQLYNHSEATFYSEEEATLTIDFYSHLAPETVKAIKSYFEEGYYDNAFFYQFVSEDTYQYMVGDLEYKDGEIVQKAIKPALKGEFASNGVNNGELGVKQGSVGLWRSYYQADGVLNTSSNARNSGRATLFLPTDTNNSFDGYVCMFGKFDMKSNEATLITEALDAIFAGDEYTDEYVIYFTGSSEDYDESKDNAGLTFNCVPVEDFNPDEIENLFEAEGNQLDMFNHYTIKVPKVISDSGKMSAMIAGINVK